MPTSVSSKVGFETDTQFDGLRQMGFDGAVRAPDGAPLQLWRHDLQQLPSAEGLAALSVDERSRAERFKFERDARRYLSARAFLREILARCTGVPAAKLRIASGPYGKPCLPDLPNCQFNLSHAGDLALVATSDSACVGVDVEMMRAGVDALALARSCFSAGEIDTLRGLEGAQRDAAFLRIWTRKEACLKALGTGLSMDPTTVEVGMDARATLAFEGSDAPAPVSVRSLAPTEGWVAAVAWTQPHRHSAAA